MNIMICCKYLTVNTQNIIIFFIDLRRIIIKKINPLTVLYSNYYCRHIDTNQHYSSLNALLESV